MALPCLESSGELSAFRLFADFLQTNHLVWPIKRDFELAEESVLPKDGNGARGVAETSIEGNGPPAYFEVQLFQTWR